MPELDEQLLSDITVGATVLGSGGGGDPYLGMLLARAAIREHGPVELVALADLPDDAHVGFLAAVGAPGVLIEKIPRPADGVAALDMLEKHLGRPFTHIAPIEAGGLNAVTPLSAAAVKGIPVVDADGMGRAFPFLDMVTPTLYDGSATPMAFADEHGNRMVLETVTNSWSEAVGRAITVASGGIMFFASYPMSGAQAKEWLIEAPLQRAADIGAVLRQARSEKRSPVDALLSAHGGHRVVEGRISGIERRTEGGFNLGEAVIEGLGVDSGRTVRLLFQNEYLVVRDEDDVLVTTPDIIMTLEAESGEPIPAEELRYGFRVCVIGLPCDERWHTEAGLALTGPRRFGYDLDAVRAKSASSVSGEGNRR